MSLLVHAFVYDENNKMQILEKDFSDTMAGFESCRKNLYGNAISTQLGLKILPTLAVEDLYVSYNDLQTLKQEVEIILQNLDLYANEGNYQREYMETRLGNVLNAIEDAQNVRGQVVIW